MESVASDLLEPVDVNKVTAMVELARAMCPNIAPTIDITLFTTMMKEAYRTVDLDYGMKEAREWQQGKPPWGLDVIARVARHEQLITDHYYNLPAATRTFLQPSAVNRLSPDRVDKLSAQNPERHLLYDLVKGMPITTVEGFVTNGSQTWPPLRKNYLKVCDVVNRLVFESYVSQDKALIVTKAFALTHLASQLHLSPMDWKPKQANKKGRPTMDCSDGGPGNFPLNDPYVKSWTSGTWGKIQLTMIAELATMVWEFAQEHRLEVWDSMDAIIIDIKAAFNLIQYHPDSAGLMASETSDGYILIFLFGTFGWTGTPGAFNVVSRAIIFEVRLRLNTLARSAIYVDDITTITSRKHVNECIRIITEVITSLLGPDTVAEDKTMVTSATIREAVAIGYVLDLQRQRVGVARKNILKSLYGFFTTDIDALLPVAHIERLASWGSRYAAITEILRPFTQALYNTICYKKKYMKTKLSPQAQLAVLVFRAVLVLTLTHPDHATKPMVSFVDSVAATHVIEFDSSLFRTASLLFGIDPVTGNEALLGGTTVCLKGLDFKVDSSYQNTSEFFGGAVVGLVTLCAIAGTTKLGKVSLRGDSISALTWAEKGRVKSHFATNACICMVLIQYRLGIDIAPSTHLEAVLNWAADTLSRCGDLDDDISRAVNELCYRDPDRFRTLPYMMFKLEHEPWIELCDHRRDLSIPGAFSTWLTEAWQLIESLIRGQTSH